MGSNDVGSVAAHYLFKAAYGVVIHDASNPTSTYRNQDFYYDWDAHGRTAGLDLARCQF